MSNNGVQATLKDVARAANCSTAVVSTVINKAKGNTLVSSEMRRRVEKVARDLGYRPNFASRSLVRKRSSTLGVYIAPGPWAGPGFAYEGEILKGIEPACRVHGYDLLLINLTGNQTPDACIEKFAERRIDGLLLLHVEPGAPWIKDLVTAGHNVVAIDYPEPEPGLSVVSFDNAAVSVLAVKHLRQLGHRKIGFIGSCRQPLNLDGAVRQESFIREMRRNGHDVPPEWIFDVGKLSSPLRRDENVCQIEGELAAEHIRRLGAAGPTAWIAYSDLTAVSAMAKLRELGINVPEDVSLVGVDDSEWSRMVTPRLTSIRHPLEEMGRQAVEMLIQETRGERVAGHGRKESQVVRSPELVARESTAPPSRGSSPIESDS